MMEDDSLFFSCFPFFVFVFVSPATSSLTTNVLCVVALAALVAKGKCRGDTLDSTLYGRSSPIIHPVVAHPSTTPHPSISPYPRLYRSKMKRPISDAIARNCSLLQQQQQEQQLKRPSNVPIKVSSDFVICSAAALQTERLGWRADVMLGRGIETSIRYREAASAAHVIVCLYITHTRVG